MEDTPTLTLSSQKVIPIINLIDSSDEESESEVEPDNRNPESNAVIHAWDEFERVVLQDLSKEDRALYTPPYLPNADPKLLFLLHWRPYHPGLPGTPILDFKNPCIHWVQHHFPDIERYSVHDLYCKMEHMYKPNGDRKTNDEIYGHDSQLSSHFELAYRFIYDQDAPVVLFGRVVREWFVNEFEAIFEESRNRYVFKTNQVERSAYCLDHPEYLLRWAAADRYQFNMKIIEDIALAYKVPVQLTNREIKVDNVRVFVYKPTKMREIATKDKKEKKDAREQTARQKMRERKVQEAAMSEHARIEIEKKRKASKDGWAIKWRANYFSKSAEERADIHRRRLETRKNRYVKKVRLPEIRKRQGERYRATVAAKTEEERRRPIELQKLWYAGRSEEEKAITRKRKAEAIALKSEEEVKASYKKMVDAKAAKSDAEKMSQHEKTKATWAAKTDEEMKRKVEKTAATIKAMTPEARKASLANTEIKKKATAAEKERRKKLGLPELTQSEIRSRSWEKKPLLQPQ